MDENQQQWYAQGYQVGYQHGMEAGKTANAPAPGTYPMTVMAHYPQRSSRLLMLFMIFKPILLIPHLVVMWFLSMGAGIVMFIAWFAVVFTGSYPKGLWDFMMGFQRWSARVNAYMMGLVDEYPPFSLE